MTDRHTASSITDEQLAELYVKLDWLSGDLVEVTANRDMHAAQLRELLAERNRLAVELGRAERTITDTAEMLRAALRRLERGRD